MYSARLVVVLLVASAAGCSSKAPTSSAVAQPTWIAAAGGKYEGHEVTVRVVSAKHGILYVDEKAKEWPATDGAATNVVLEVSNLSTTRKIDLRPGRVDLQGKATDELGNSYEIRRGLIWPGGESSVYPGKTARVLIATQPLVGAAKELRLEIPPGTLGVPETIRFSVPASMIEQAK